MPGPTLDAETDVVALVHVAGPVETEPADVELGHVWLQRCLVCDQKLVGWAAQPKPGFALRAGSLVATDPYGVPGQKQMKRYSIEGRELRDGEARCVATPVVAL